jgi:hypothetical protein
MENDLEKQRQNFMNADFFNSLPKPGQFVQVPGGVVWCNSWDVNYVNNGEVNGEIVFRFRVDREFAGMVQSTPALPERVRELPAQPLSLTESRHE